MRKLFVILAAVAFVFAFTTPAKADVAISGYIAFQTYMEDIDNPGAAKDTDDLIWGNDPVCSRLTLAFKDGPFGGLVEVRPLNGSYFRHWWGTWNFGAGTLGIGQFWTPDFNPISTDKYGCGAMSGLGAGGTVRAPMIQLQFGNLKIAAATPHVADVITPYSAASTTITTAAKAAKAKPPLTDIIDGPYADGNALYYVPASGTKTTTETSLPKLMASYNLNVAMVGLKLFGGYQTYDQVVTATDQSVSIDSYMAGVNATLGFGPLTVAGQVWTASNPIEYGTGDDEAGYLTATATGTTINDADFMAYGINLAYKVNDAWTVTGGYTAATSDRTEAGVETEWESSQYHVNATWRVAKNVYISPEYIVLDRGDITVGGVSTEQVTDTRFGVYWRIKF